MKITIECIDSNAARIVKECVGDPYEYADKSDTAERTRLLTLGYIRGVLDLAEILKMVIEAEDEE